MCGDEGNLIAEGFGVAVIAGRYLWVAHQARGAVAAAEAMVGAADGVVETPSIGADRSDELIDAV